jgi:hypothetical protein
VGIGLGVGVGVGMNEGVGVGVGNPPNVSVGTVRPSGVAVGPGVGVGAGLGVGISTGGTLVGTGGPWVASAKGGNDGTAVGKMMGVGVATSLDGPSAPQADPTHAIRMAGTNSIFGMQSSWTGLGSLVNPRSSAGVPYMFATCKRGMGGGAYGIRTRDLRLERAMSLAARRMRHCLKGCLKAI